jgi:hypothetical protein
MQCLDYVVFKFFIYFFNYLQLVEMEKVESLFHLFIYLGNTPIWDYQLQHNAIIPLIAKTYALNFALNYVKDRWVNQSNLDSDEGLKIIFYFNLKIVVRLCCVIKPIVTWHGERASSICRGLV